MKSPCSCATSACRSGPFERPRFFPGQLVGAAELNLQQEYFRNRLRLHNRMLHGWGVVCGALVCLAPAPARKKRNHRSHSAHDCPTEPRYGGQDSPDEEWEPWTVRVQPGYILGPYGDEILIDSERTLDLRTKCITGIPGEDPGQSFDPWCSTVPVKPQEGPLYVAVRYREVATRPVRVQPAGCGCEELQCEDSRWHDCYEICVLNHCPESHQRTETHREEPGGVPLPPWLSEIAGRECAPNPPCPDCPEDSWVVLAEVHVDPSGAVQRIDNCSCRRIVASFGSFWWQCCEPRHEPPETEPTPEYDEREEEKAPPPSRSRRGRRKEK